MGCIFVGLRSLLILLFLLVVQPLHAARAVSTDTSGPIRSRVWTVGAAQTAVWAGTFIALNQAWYADYPKQPFHLFNDWPEWQQMDKAGHVWTTYQVSRLSGDIWKWTGIHEKKAIWLGGISGLAFQSIIEIQDGFSEKWGFSLTDMASNVVGAGLYVSQALGWKEQRIQVKFSYYPYAYPQAYQARADQLFGASAAERILKDYNSQTYWLSFNLKDFFKSSGIPAWLNLSVGYGARLMLGGQENKWEDGGTVYDYTAEPRYRRILLSADIDLTRIRTKSAFLRSVFSAVNMIKIPAPALEYNTQGQWKLHGIYF